MRADSAAREVATLHVRDVPASVSRLAVLGAKIWDWWHPSQNLSLSSNTVTAWAGMYRNTSLPKTSVPNQPPYAIDGANFRGKKAVQFAISGPKLLQLDSGSDLFAVTDKPTLIHVGRNRATASSRNLLTVLAPGVTAALEVQCSAGTLLGIAVNSNGTLISSGAALGTTPHVTAAGLSGTELFAYLDSTLITPNVATSGNFGAALRTISVGGSNGVGTDLSTVEFGILTAPPTAGEWTALLALFRAEWATP